MHRPDNTEDCHIFNHAARKAGMHKNCESREEHPERPDPESVSARTLATKTLSVKAKYGVGKTQSTLGKAVETNSEKCRQRDGRKREI